MASGWIDRGALGSMESDPIDRWQDDDGEAEKNASGRDYQNSE